MQCIQQSSLNFFTTRTHFALPLSLSLLQRHRTRLPGQSTVRHLAQRCAGCLGTLWCGIHPDFRRGALLLRLDRRHQKVHGQLVVCHRCRIQCLLLCLGKFDIDNDDAPGMLRDINENLSSLSSVEKNAPAVLRIFMVQKSQRDSATAATL